MGSWSFHLSGPHVISDSMAQLMVRNQHSHKGALAHSRSTGTALQVQESPYTPTTTVVQCLETRSTKDPNLAHLLRCLFFFLTHHNISYRVFHVACKNNHTADALSRNLFMSPPCFCRSCWMTQSPGHQITGETRSEPIRERLS